MEAFTFSKKGDEGETSLLSGERVSKASIRPEAYGTLDEASSVLGMSKAFTQNEIIRNIIGTIQEDLLVLGAELSCQGEKKEAWTIGPDRTGRLEAWIKDLQREVPLPQCFIYPGGNPASASIDLARTIIRRAERRVVALKAEGELDSAEVLRYLNRLADLLFTLARFAGEKG
ncbi:MAG: cob(I)yrinic acid a,c-diamide adenosyltransferase [Syntrophobacteraceae bacterium]